MPPAAAELRAIALRLALEEVMLQEGASWLEVWEPPARAAVLGVSSCAQEELYLEACRSNGLGVLRRISGGAAVYLAPGAICVGAVLPYELFPDSRSIRGAYRILASAIQEALSERLQIHAVFEPPADLATGGRKLVGFAQARRKTACLVHAVLPVELEPAEVAMFLRHPPNEPPYRAGRSHEEFMTSLARERALVSTEAVVGILRESLGASFPEALKQPGSAQEARAEGLAEEKYLSDEWTFRR